MPTKQELNTLTIYINRIFSDKNLPTQDSRLNIAAEAAEAFKPGKTLSQNLKSARMEIKIRRNNSKAKSAFHR
jgi:hypothetical protein